MDVPYDHVSREGVVYLCRRLGGVASEMVFCSAFLFWFCVVFGRWICVGA